MDAYLSPCLLGLPAELIVIIANQLPFKNYLRLGLVCRRLREITRDPNLLKRRHFGGPNALPSLVTQHYPNIKSTGEIYWTHISVCTICCEASKGEERSCVGICFRCGHYQCRRIMEVYHSRNTGGVREVCRSCS
jgi:hypothetical protein